MERILALSAWAVISVLTVACGEDDPSGDVDTFIDDGPAALTRDAMVTFTFHAEPEGRGFVCTINGAAAACTSPFATTVAEGEHTFTIAALDMLDRQDATPASRTWRTDLTPPDTTISRAPAAIDDDPSPEFEFTGADPNGAGAPLTFECALDGLGFVHCESPQLFDLGEGSHALEIRAVDAAGNPDPTPATHAWVVDTSSPDTEITAGPAEASTTGPTPQFTFTSSDPAATFECQIDATAYVPCVSPSTTPALLSGAHTFTVRAWDVNSVVDPTPAMRAFTVDADAPDVTITQTPPLASNDPTPSFAFISTDPTATFECQINTGGFVSCGSPYTTPVVPDGTNTFRVRAVDPVGNRTTPAATYAWSVDTIAPTVAITGQPSNPTSDNTPLVSFSTTGGPTVVQCQVDTGAFADCGSPFTAAVLADGPHTITISVADAAGNTATAQSMFAIDTTPPMVTITGQPTNPTSDSTPTFTFTVTGAATVECRVDTAAFAPCTSPVTTGPLSDASHTFQVRATDTIGNAQTVDVTFIVDTQPPSVSITSSPPNPTNSSTPTFVFTTAGAPTLIQCQLDAGAFTTCASPYTTPTLSEASHTVTIQATDAAGNSGQAARTFVVDVTSPIVTLTSQPTSTTNDNTPTVAFSISGGAISTQCQVDGGAFVTCTSPFNPAAMSDGLHTITVRSSDSAGNVGTAIATFTIDTGAPGVTIVSSPPNPTNDNTATVTFTTFGMPVLVECQIDGGAFVACTSPFTTGALPDASHTITVRASDGVGNSGTAFRTFVVDTTSPIVAITIPPTTPFNDSTPSTTFAVSGGAILTQCQIDGGAFATCSSPFTAPPLADGSHSLLIRATDAAGNLGSATATFVIDTVAPTVMITAAPASLTNDATPSVSFTFAGAPSSIQCRVDTGAFVACTSPFTSPALADGMHTITVRVTDAATNTTSDTASFDLDATAPVITITSAPPAQTNDTTPTVGFTIAGTPVLIECQVDAGGFAPCASPFTSATVAEGAHTIAVRATDLAGNASTVPVSFTVDTIAPTVTITSQPPVETNDNTATVVFTTAGAPSSTQCQIDAGAFATCISPFTTAALLDGLHTITIRVTDLATNSSTASATFTVDVVAPSAMFTATPSNPTNNPTPSIGFTTAGSPTVIECRLDADPFAPCTSPYLPGTLADGSHTIRVRVTDAATNSSTITTTFVVDTQAPTVVFVTQPPDPTNDTTPTVTFTTGGAPSTIQCKVDGGAFTTCNSGTFTATLLADGGHSITVRVTDAATNFTEIVATFTVDTAPPTVTLTAQPANPTNDTTPTIAFTASADATATTCQIDAGAFVACTSPFTASPALSQGNHSLTVRVVDAAGNAATATTGTFVIDTTAPVVTITAPASPTNDNTPDVVFTAPGATSFTCQVDADAPVACVSPFTPPLLTDAAHTVIVRATDAATNTGMASTTFTVDTTPPMITITTVPPDPTNDATPTLAFIIVNGPATTECQIDTGTFTSCTTPFTPAVDLSNAQHTITIRATDTAGNQGTDAATFTVDTVPPVVTITTAPPTPTNDTTPSIAFTVTGGTTTCQVDAGTAVACAPPSFTAPTALAEGLHSFTIVGSDLAGNTATEVRSFTVDTTAPSVTLDAVPPAQTTDPTPSVAFTVTGATTIQCQIDMGAVAACTSPFTAPALADGAHTITVFGIDLANNSNSATAAFTIDTVLPTIALTGGPTGGFPTGDATQTFTFAASGETGIECRVAPAAAFSACTSPFTTAALTPGEQAIDIRAFDAAGNTATVTAKNDLDPTAKCLDGTTTQGDTVITGLVETLDAATVEFWFRASAAGGTHELYRFDAPSVTDSPFIAITTVATDIEVTVDGNGSQAGVLNQRLFIPDAGHDLTAWHHYAIVFTGSLTRLFIDGVEVTTAIQVGSQAPGFDDAFGTVGAPIEVHVGGAGGAADGAFLDLRLSSIARYAASFTPTYQPLTTPADTVLRYPLDEGGMSTQSFDVLVPASHIVTWTDAVWGVCF